MKDSLVIPAIFVLIFLYFASIVNFGLLDLLHDSMLYKPALDLLNGHPLYKGSYTQYGAVPVLFHAAVISVFGNSLLNVRLSIAVIYALIACLLYYAWSEFLTCAASLLALVAWLSLQHVTTEPILCWAAVYALFFQSIALVSLIEARRRPPLIILAGFCSGAALMCKQNVGFFLFAAELLAIIYLPAFKGARFKSIMRCVSGAAVCIIPALIWFLKTEAVHDWYLQNIVWPQVWASNFGTHGSVLELFLKFFFPSSPFTPFPIVYTILALSTFVSAFCLLFIKRLSNPNFHAWGVTTIISLASWAQFYPVSGQVQLGASVSPMVGLVLVIPYLLPKIEIRTAFSEKLNLNKMAFAVLVGIICIRGILGIKHFSEELHSIKTKGPLFGIKANPDLIGQVENFQKFLGNTESSFQDAVLEPLSQTPLLLTLIEGHRPFHPLWFSAQKEIIDKIYPDYISKLHNHILSKNAPVIVSRYYSLKKGCETNSREDQIESDSPIVDLLNEMKRTVIWSGPIEDKACLTILVFQGN